MNKVYGQTLLDDMVHHQSLPMPLVKQAAREILAIIREGLIRDGVVNVSNFGTFRLKPVAARQGVNPQTREPLIIPAHHRVIFSPCKALRELIQPEHHSPVPIQDAVVPNAIDNSVEDTSASSNKTEHMQSDGARSSENPIEISSHVPLSPPPNGDSLSSPMSLIPEKEGIAPGENAIGQSTETVAEPVKMVVETVQPEKEDSNESASFSIELEEYQTEAKATNTPSGKNYYFGAAAVLVIALISAFLLIESNTEVENAPKNLASAAPLISSHATVPKSAGTPPDQAETMVSLNTPVQSTPANPSPPKKEVSDQTNGEEAIKQATINESSERRDIRYEVDEQSPARQSPPPVVTQVQNPYFVERAHEIDYGDSLWRLARTLYQDPLLWPHIYQANTNTIEDPDQLLEGKTIVIPELEGSPGSLSKADRRNIAEGYYLTYLHYKKTGRKEAFFALLEAKRYDSNVVKEHRKLLQLSRLEEILLSHQQTMPF